MCLHKPKRQAHPQKQKKLLNYQNKNQRKNHEPRRYSQKPI